MTQEILLQISAGDGPAECAWAVMRTLEKVLEDASQSGLEARLIELDPGPQKNTAHSALISISGASVQMFGSAWCGTVQWIARSPFRPEHKRKNWFIGIELLPELEKTHFSARDIRWETMRASGPGGQHVNRTESAVRVTHVPTGIQASSSQERSQYRNRQLALVKLAKRIADQVEDGKNQLLSTRWKAHHNLERGNPIRIFRP